MAWGRHVYILYLYTLYLVNAQITPSFNDWTASGVEKETELLFRVIDKARYDSTEMINNITRTEDNASTTHLATLKEIYDKTSMSIGYASDRASKAGYPLCVIKARIDETAIIGRYQAQVRVNYDFSRAASTKFKATTLAARTSFAVFDFFPEILLLRACRNPLTMFVPGAVVACYKTVLGTFTAKVKVVMVTMEAIKSEYESVVKGYDDLKISNQKSIAQAKADTDITVAATLKCANLNKRPPLEVTLEQIAKLNATTSDYLILNISFLEASVNSLKVKLNLTQNFIGDNVQAAVQPFFPAIKYLTLLGLSATNELNIINTINSGVQKGVLRLNALLSSKTKEFDIFLDFVRNIYAKYKLELSYVSEANLTKLCVPQDPVEQDSKEEEIKKCLANLFLRYSTAAQEALDSMALQIRNYSAFENDVSILININFTSEINISFERIKADIIALLISYGYKLELILEIIETHFSSPRYYSVILQNQLNIKANLGAIKASVDSVLKNLDNEVDTVLSRLVETIQVLNELNPKYNVSFLVSTLSKWKIEIKKNITAFVTGKYNNALGIATPALAYNYDVQLNLLIQNAVKCFPVDLFKLNTCFEPLTTAYNITIGRAILLSINTLTDTNYIVQVLPNELKQFVDTIFNKTKIDVRILSVDELTKANPGTDYRREVIIKFMDENENKIKGGGQGSIAVSMKAALANKEFIDKFRLNLESLYRQLRITIEKKYSQVSTQPLSLPGKTYPCQVMPNIDRAINTSLEYITIISDNTYSGYSRLILTDVKNQVVNILISFVIDLRDSNCTRYITQKVPYEDCIKDINAKYAAALNVAEGKVTDYSKLTGGVSDESLTLLNRLLTSNELKVVDNRINRELQIQEKQVNELLTNPNFFQVSLQNALKEYEQATIFANSIKTSFDISNFNIKFVQFQIALNVSAEPLKLTLNTIGENINVSPSLEYQNILQNTYKLLTSLLQNSSFSYQGINTSSIKIAFEKANNIIESLRIQIISKNNIELNKINSYLNFIVQEGDKFTENAVKENCKGVSVILFKNCVQSYFGNLITNLKAKKLQIDDVVKIFSNTTISADLNNFDQQIKAELTKLNDKLQNEIDKVKYEEEIVQNAILLLNNSVTSDFVSLINNLNTAIGKQVADILKIGSTFREDITALLTRNSPLTKEKERIIEESAQIVYNNTYFTSGVVSVALNFSDSYLRVINVALKTFNQTIKPKCFNESKTKDTFNDCVQKAVGEYKTIINEIITEVNTIGQRSTNFSECGKKEIEKVISDELNKTETFVNEEKSDIVNQCLKQINSRIEKEVNNINKTLNSIEELKKAIDTTKIEISINETLSTWGFAIDYAIKLNQKNESLLNLEKQRLNDYRVQLINTVNNKIQTNLNEAIKVESLVNAILDNLKLKTFASLNQSCESVYANYSAFNQCISEQCAKLNGEVDTLAQTIVGYNDTVQPLLQINATVNDDIKSAEEKVKVESEKVIIDNNVTASDIVNAALGDFSKYNITPYTQDIQVLRDKAIKLQEYAIAQNQSANNLLNRVNILLALHVYAASVVCPKRNTQNETNHGIQVIELAKNKLYPLFPDTTAYTTGQLALANQLNATLQSEITKLIELEKNCENKDLYKLVECVQNAVESFGNYFNNATSQVKIYTADEIQESVNRTNDLNKWRQVDVNAEYERLKVDLKPIPEGVYNECNVTKEQLLDFAEMNMENRRAKFNNSIPEAVKNIIATGNGILNTDYSGIVNMNETLQEPVNFTRQAIEDILKSANASQITPEVQAEVNRLIGVGTNESDQFILNLHVTAREAIQKAQTLLEEYESLNKNTNRSAVEKACFNSSSEFPMSDFVVCNNEYNYQYELKLQNIQKQLDAILAELQNINTNGRQLVVDNSNKVAVEIKEKSALYAIFLYFNAGLPRPAYLDPYVKDGCLVRVNGDPRKPCIVFS